MEELSSFRHEAVCLETLRIDVSQDLLDERDEDGDVNDELPQMFAGVTPGLRHLSLRFFTKFSTNNFANLNVLHLSDQLYRRMEDIHHLLVLLTASPGLEELSLTSCDLGVVASFATPAEDGYIPMYHLRRLSFVDCHAAIMNRVLSCIELGNDGIGILCKGWEPSEQPLSSIFPPKHASRLHALHDITTLDLTYDTAEILATGPSTAVRLVLDVTETLLPSLAALFPLPAISELRLAGIDLHAADVWRSAFASMPSLRRLVLWLPPTDPAKWLAALDGGRRLGAAVPFPAPALAELCVFPPYAEAWGAVAALVRRRRADGHPLRRLCVLCERDTRDAALRRAFEGWKADVAALDGAVEEVVFETVPRYRRGDVPEAFRTFIGR